MTPDNDLEFENSFSQYVRNAVHEQGVTDIATCLARSLATEPGP